MSFILDALKKSENERQQQREAEFSSVPAGAAQPRGNHWLWLLGVLLAVNAAVLVGLLMRADTPAVELATLEAIESPVAATPTFAEQLAVARENQPALASNQAAGNATPQTLEVERPEITTSSRVPTIDELRVQGSLQLADLHIDIHVYSDEPEGRFVFINMVKHREQSILAEGPVVNEITSDGVILDYQGQTFLLPRE